MSNLNHLDFIKFYLKRSNYENYYTLLDKDLLNLEVLKIIEAIPDYYTSDRDSKEVSTEAFKTWFLQFHLKTDNKDNYNLILDMVNDRPEINQKLIIKEMIKSAAVTKIVELTSNKLDDDSIGSIRTILDEVELSNNDRDEIEEARLTKTIDECLEESDFSGGYKWPLECLNTNINPFPAKGVLLALAARPDCGKSSITLSFIGHFAKQMQDDDVILWFNNENIKERAANRCASAVLNRSVDDLLALKRKGVKIHEHYLKAQGGKNRIEFFDIHDWNTAKVERCVKRYKKNVKCIVVDMVDHLKAPGKFQGRHEELEYIYQWALKMACTYASVIVTSQVSALKDGRDPRWLELEDLAGSKTGKQGAVTIQLMVGHLDDSPMRYLRTPKNKFGRGGHSWKSQAIFDSRTGQLKEV